MLKKFSTLSPARRSLVLLVIIYIGFISLGLPDTVLGVAWESMAKDLSKPLFYAGIITALLTCCSAVSATLSGYILRLLGTGRLLVICGFITGAALLGYATAPAFWVLLLFAIPLGFGQGAIDTGMNFYVAKNYTSRDMSWLHCCWGVGATFGPLIMTGFIANSLSWRWGYAVVGGIQLLLATLFLSTLGLWKNGSETAQAGHDHPTGKVNYSLRFWMCVATFFIYCGVELGVGLWGNSFLIRCRGVSEDSAGFWIAAYWGSLMAGRFLMGLVANRLGNRRLIRYSALLAIAGGILLAIPGVPGLAQAALMLLGLAVAAIYPCMMHEAPKRFDDATAAAVTGFQGGAAMLGGGTLPFLIGLVASETTFAILPWIVIGVFIAIFLMQAVIDGWSLNRR